MPESPWNSVEDPVGLHRKTGDDVVDSLLTDPTTGAAADGRVMRGGGCAGRSILS